MTDVISRDCILSASACLDLPLTFFPAQTRQTPRRDSNPCAPGKVAVDSRHTRLPHALLGPAHFAVVAVR